MFSQSRSAVTVAGGFALAAWMAGSAVAADAPKAAGAATAKAKAPAAAAEWPARVPRLSAEQIIEKHIAARGGAAWNSVQTLQFTGKLEAGKADSLQRTTAMFQQDKRFRGKAEPKTAAADGKDAGKQVELPFTLDFKRPHKTRMEITFAGKTAWQVYDGEHGWKFRPFLNRTDVEPFTAEETETEAHQDNLGGPLFDYAARGVKVSVERADTVDGNDAYKLKLVPKEGPSRYIWIDAKSFLDVKVEGTPRRMDGRKHDVFVIQRDFRKVQGVMLPFLLETAVDGYPDTHKMRIENATVNPTLDDKLFTKPAA